MLENSSFEALSSRLCVETGESRILGRVRTRVIAALPCVTFPWDGCGGAVLRGANVFGPGVVAAPKHMKAGDLVSVFSDLEGRCTRGAAGFHGNKAFVGNGVAEMDRSGIFRTEEPARGVAVRMVEPLYRSPSFDGVLPGLVFLQNLPSVVVGHVLGPRPGEKILDMCAAPGGKTCHIASLMGDQGEVVALDRIRNKIDRIRQNAKTLGLRSVRACCFNSTQAAGDLVSVFSDLEGRCTRGAAGFHGNKAFVGNGVAEMDRSGIFRTEEPARGVAVRMVEPLYRSPSFDGVLPGLVFLQNLPSVVVGHVLGPRPGEKILDMCAAPGGKTCHIASLMGDQGEVVALDRIRNKIDRIRQNAKALGLHSVRACCFNSTQAVGPPQGAGDEAPGPPQEAGDEAPGPPFPPESFDRVLLDAPCSGLGQRPNMANTWSLKEIRSYPPLQRKLLQAAVGLLKKGGVLVYSTCTVTLGENEEQVAWALRTFPCLSLQPQGKTVDVHLLK
ncbi:unnamed protein product [Menidia menidia]|uniref:(Atlantic silverside) hypothetical protein n=1 Tax=Menidia menidia TaxID=238744 RepID=A0A8S4AWH3_9TELE|nr:unnamed protein product [Menidia menidia]